MLFKIGSEEYSFQKKKKKKKESHYFKWRVSKKQVFLKKYYPKCHREQLYVIKSEGSSETVWVEIFSKTRRAWTWFFVNLELIFALFFFIFYFEYPIQMLLFNRMKCEGMGVDLECGRLGKGCKILRDGWKIQIK